VDDDNPTSVLDLEALTQASRRKADAATGPATTPTPPMGMGAAPPSRGLPTDTMRLDVESLSGPMAIPALSPEQRASVVSLPDPQRASIPFDPSHIGLADGRASVASPPPMGPVGAAVGPTSGPGHALGPSVHPGGEAVAPNDGAASSPGAKPAWQTNVDRGLSSIGATSKEASSRFASWFGALGGNEQMAFVAGAVLGFLIVVMIFVLIVT
jgi:hypothetical protein